MEILMLVLILLRVLKVFHSHDQVLSKAQIPNTIILETPVLTNFGKTKYLLRRYYVPEAIW